MKKGKINFGFSYTYMKYGKFWSIFPVISSSIYLSFLKSDRSSAFLSTYYFIHKNMLTWTTSLDGNPGAKTLPHPKNTIHKVPKNSPKSSLVKMEKSPGLGNPRSWCQSIRGMTDLILAKNLNSNWVVTKSGWMS